MIKFNLLYVITKLELGGAQKQLLSLISGLDKDKYNVFLYTAKEGILISDVEAISGLKLCKSIFLDRPIHPLKDLLAVHDICKFIKKNNIDLVHTHSSKAGIIGRIAARLARAKLIVHTVHGWSFNKYQNPIVRWFYVALERICASFSNKIIVVSNCDLDKGLANRIADFDKYFLIRYGIERDRFKIQDCKIRQELKIGDNELIVGMIACFKNQKAPLDFIKLCSLVNRSIPVKFILVGDGVLREKIEKLILRLKLNKQIILTGWRRDVERLISAFDVFVLTSLWEGLPISVLEAFAAAKPVLATDTGGIREIIIEGETGFLTSCQDVNSMAEKLVRLLKDEPMRQDIGRQARDFLGTDFDLEIMVKNTDNLYMNLLGR